MRWRLNYSFADTVGLKVAFFPKPDADVAAQVFDIELHNVGLRGKDRWLVSFWSPSGGASISRAASGGGPPIGATTSKNSIRGIWLVLPIALILGSMLSVLVLLGVRGKIRSHRAERAYRSS